jgi:hypothetical protein
MNNKFLLLNSDMDVGKWEPLHTLMGMQVTTAIVGPGGLGACLETHTRALSTSSEFIIYSGKTRRWSNSSGVAGSGVTL